MCMSGCRLVFVRVDQSLFVTACVLSAFNPGRTWGVAYRIPVNLYVHHKPRLRLGVDVAQPFFHFVAQYRALTPAGSRFARFGAMDVQVRSLA
jgi:hypothetical protein